MVSVSLGLLLAGCADTPPWGSWSTGPSPQQIQAGLARLDHYAYFPAYEIYYNRTQQQYVYQDGGLWVTRSEPPQEVPLNVLQASPSVAMDFSDNPAWHHAVVAKQYPKNWESPTGSVAATR